VETRILGKTGWEVGVIGLGAWNIGGQWGEVTEGDALATIHAALEGGVNLIDTADAYGIPPGRCEELVGKAIRSWKQNVIVCTKVGEYAERYGHPLSYRTPLHVTLCCEASLRRLGVDAIDLYLCHIGYLDNPSIFLEAFSELKKAGKIREYGISAHYPEVVERFNKEDACAVVELDYSIINRRHERELLPYCLEHNIGTIVRGALRRGILSGKYQSDTRFSDSVRKVWNSGRGRDTYLRMLDIVEQLRFLESTERSMANAALQFVLANPAVSVVLAGAKTPEQAKSNALASGGRLSAEELAKIGSVVREMEAIVLDH